MKADDLFKQLTDSIVSEIEAGAGDWNMPWNKLARLPISRSTGKPYRGINALILGVTSEDRGWSSNEWATFNQWKNLGFYVQKDEKHTKAFFWDTVAPSKAKLAADPDAKPFPMARIFQVFAREQTDAPPWEPPEPLPEHERHEAAEAFFASVGADVRYGGDRAFYAPVQDFVQVPLIGQFPVRDHFYSTLAHEHTHWTGHESRLNRRSGLDLRFGTEAYAMEELCAELGAAFIGAQLGLDQATRQDHTSYLAGWLKVLKADPKALVSVTSKAQAALDHLNKLAAPVVEAELVDA